MSDSSSAISYQQTKLAQPTTPPLVDWGEEEESFSTSVPLSAGGPTMKSAWLSKFLSAAGAKPYHDAAHDFEVTLPTGREI